MNECAINIDVDSLTDFEMNDSNFDNTIRKQRREKKQNKKNNKKVNTAALGEGGEMEEEKGEGKKS